MGKKDKDKKKNKKKEKKEKKKKKNRDSLVEQTVAADAETVEESESILEYIQPTFVEDGARTVHAADLVQVVEAREALSQQFGADQTLGRFHDGALLMLSLLEDYRTGRYTGVSFWSVAVMVFGFQYVLKPIDIIPDDLPGIGQLDDTMVMAHCLEMVKEDLLDYKEQTLTREDR